MGPMERSSVYYKPLNMSTYSEIIKNKEIPVNQYDSTDVRKIAALDGKANCIDTALELALYDSPSFRLNIEYIDIRYSSPQTVDIKTLMQEEHILRERPTSRINIPSPEYPSKRDEMLTIGAAVYGEFLMNRSWDWFGRVFGNDPQTERYEEMLNRICWEGDFTRKDIENYYKEMIPLTVEDCLCEHFNTKIFSIGNQNVMLTFQPESGDIKLLYGEPNYVDGNIHNLDSFLLALADRDFDTATRKDIASALNQIPAVQYMLAGRIDLLRKLNTTLTDFLLEPSDSARASLLRVRNAMYSINDDMHTAFMPALRSINSVLANEYPHWAKHRTAIIKDSLF